MFDEDIASTGMLISLETALKIELAPDIPVRTTVDQAVARLENTYNVKFDKDIFTLMEESALVSDQLSFLMRDVMQALMQVSFYTDLKLYHKNIPFNLVDVNYLGYARNQILTALRYFQDSSTYVKHADELVSPLYDQLNSISICTVKRLFIVLLMLHRLGIEEGVSIIARLLYIGGLIV